ncbi:hypothetical protein HYW18_02365 [Candidatus Uhrbacteria bacterium]|nr:hypothetical protein [Candidatus Uhrbacteria bacterium]
MQTSSVLHHSGLPFYSPDQDGGSPPAKLTRVGAWWESLGYKVRFVKRPGDIDGCADGWRLQVGNEFHPTILTYRPQPPIPELDEARMDKVFAAAGHAEIDAPPQTLEALQSHPSFWKVVPWEDSRTRTSVLLRDPLGNSIGFTYAPFESVYDQTSVSSTGMSCS